MISNVRDGRTAIEGGNANYPSPEDRYRESLASGLSDAEAREDAWPQGSEGAAAAPGQTGAKIPPAVTDADLRAIQTIREAWNRVTDAELLEIRGDLGEGVPAYQFWLELHYARAAAELARIKERYSTYRAAATAQAKLFAAQIEMLKEQLAAAQQGAKKP